MRKTHSVAVLLFLAMVGMTLGVSGCLTPTEKKNSNQGDKINSGSGENEKIVSDKKGYPESGKIAREDTFQIEGTVLFREIEGGFFVIAGDDGKIYDPVNLPEKFKKTGLKVKVTARPSADAVGIRMIGEIIEIVDIQSKNGL